MSAIAGIEIRRELTAGDADGIIELHRRVYAPEYGMDERFVAGVRSTVESALANGWPERGGVWLVDLGDELAGSLGLIDEGGGNGRVRWFVLDPVLRGQGLGRRLLGELLEEARDAGLRGLSLETFSALSSAAHLYREAGFRVTWDRVRSDWGPPIVYQHYELKL
jgi:GNAT superfamily N-acetyltransferase